MPIRSPLALLASLAVALPFVFGYSQPPSPNFWPVLASWVCAWALAAWALAQAQWGAAWARGGWAAVWSRGLVIAALLGAAVGLVQFFAGDVGWSPWIQPSTPGQAIGNLRQRNQQATLLSLGTWALLWAVGRWQERWQAEPTRRWVGLLAGLLLAWALLLLAVASAATASRTGALQWALLLALLWMWRKSLGGLPGLPFGLAVVGLVLYVAASWLLPILLEQWTGFPADRLFSRFADDGQGCGGRRVLWSNVAYLIAQKPWTGWGWGELDYAHYTTLFPGTRFCVLLDNAHDLPLHLAVELGLPVAVLATGGVLAWVLRARPWREADPVRQLAWGVLALIGLHSLLEFPLWYGPFQVTALLAVLLLWRGGWGALGSGAVRGLGAAALAAALAAGCYAAWDYGRVALLYQPVALRPAALREDTWAKVRGTRLFSSQVDFAHVTTTPVTPANALQIHGMAQQLLHFSPEPRVIEPLIESAALLGLDDEVAFHLKRYRLAYPEAYARWARGHARFRPAPGTAPPGADRPQSR
jgi:O-antigen ligase